MTNTRGVVVSHPYTATPGGIQSHNGITDKDLRHYLLYWDKIDLPENNIILVGSDNTEIAYLRECNILDSTRVEFPFQMLNQMEISEFLVQSLIKAVQYRNKQEPGCWSVIQPGDSLDLPNSSTSEVRTLDVELYNAIPIPTPNTQLDTILDFKQKRADEVLRFRRAMDALYQKIETSKDIPRSKVAVINEIEIALSDLHKVFNESWKEKLLTTVKVQLNLPAICTNAFTGMTVAPLMLGIAPEVIVVGAAIGAISSVINFELVNSRKIDQIPDTLKDFAYLHHVQKELT